MNNMVDPKTGDKIPITQDMVNRLFVSVREGKRAIKELLEKLKKEDLWLK